MAKKIYNPESTEKINKIVNGNPTGIANFVSPSRVIYKTIFEGQIARFWNPATVNITEDKKVVKELSDAEYRMYELTFGKLIFNDSIVTNRIMDNINPVITDPIANACIAFQAMEEALHSYSYAFIGDDILGSEKIYDLFKTDPKLKTLAHNINARYSKFDGDSSSITDEDKALVAIANLCLEGVSFPAGFLPIWALGDKMRGSASMITEISRNELGSHLPLYANIYKHIKEDCKLSDSLDEITKQMILQSAEDEKDFLLYSTEGVMGFTKDNINNFMDWIVSNRLRELGIEHDLIVNKEDGLIKIFKKYSELNDTKSNFFESTVKNYSKQELDMDF